MSQENSERETLNKVKEAILRSQQSVAGRDAIFLILRAFFENKLDANAKIIVVGAGWGEEILSLGKPNPEWQFVGVDLSEEMLNLARLNIAAENLPNKVELHQTDVRNLNDENFDAATCILTLHFVPDDGAKLALLQAVRKRLRPGAPFYLVDGVREADEAEYQENVAAWKRHAVNNGMPIEMIDKFVENSMNLPIVTEQRELELLREAGFTKTRKVYQGIHVGGWLSACG
jgi:tRNA (cmo5U34)-methyltransferase